MSNSKYKNVDRHLGNSGKAGIDFLFKKIKSPLAVSRTTGIFRALFIAFVGEREPETGLSGTSIGHLETN